MKKSIQLIIRAHCFPNRGVSPKLVQPVDLAVPGNESATNCPAIGKDFCLFRFPCKS